MNTMLLPLPGVTFLFPIGENPHLYFILTMPLQRDEEEKILIVNITSVRLKGEDYTLNVGDHEFIEHKSYLNYSKAEIVSVEDLERNLRRGKLKIKETVGMDTVKYICEGLRESRYSTKRAKDFCKEACKKTRK
jgi:hypothetical protein